MSNRLNAILLATLVVSVLLLQLTGCAGVSPIDTPMVVDNQHCKFVIARAGYWPWQPQQCLAKCVDDKQIYFASGCSSESLLSEVKGATGIIPTANVW